MTSRGDDHHGRSYEKKYRYNDPVFYEQIQASRQSKAAKAKWKSIKIRAATMGPT